MLLVRASTAPSQDITSSLTCSCLIVLARNMSRAGRQGKRQCRCARTASAGPEAAHSPEKSRRCFTGSALPTSQEAGSEWADAGELHHQGSWGTSEAKENSVWEISQSWKALLCEWAKPGWLKVPLTRGAPGMLLGSRQA